MNNETEIITAAMRWFAARGRRMDASNHKRDCDRDAKQNLVFINWHRRGAAAEQLKEAKRQERVLLKLLAKACEARRDRLGQINDACIVQLLETEA